jgi:hypothetical protein
MTRFHRGIVVATALAYAVAVLPGGGRWEQIPASDIESTEPEHELVGKKVRVYTADETIDMIVSKVEYPWLIGNDYTNGYYPVVRVNLEEVTRIETEHPETELADFALAGAGVLLAGLVVAVSIAMGLSSD